MKTAKKEFTVMIVLIGTTDIFRTEDQRERRVEGERNNCNKNKELM